MSFIRGLFATSSLSTAGQPGPFASAIPPELWDEILSHLTDDDLLRAARACKAFNSLSIRLHLSRHNIDTAALSRPTLCSSSQVLPALQLSCSSLQAKRLVCQFGSDVGVQRGLVALQNVIRRSTALRQVELTFCRDLFDAHLLDTSIPETSRSQWRLLYEFCGALAAMADKASGDRVVVISQGTFFSGRAADVGGWTLGSPKPSSSPTKLFFRGRKASAPPAPLPSTTGARQLRLHEIHSVSMHVSPAHTLFVFNNASITSLHLSTTFVPNLSTLLPELEFPALSKLVIADGIDAGALGDFLIRHPALESLEHTASSSPASLTTTPIDHPGLRTLIADGIPSITRTMHALGSSSLLDNLAFTIHPSKGEDVRGLSPVLRTIHGDSVHLGLEIKESDDVKPEHVFFLDDAAYLTARALNSVRTVRLTCTSPEMARAALAWLGVLPALSKVVFVFVLKRGSCDFEEVAKRVLEDVEVEVKVSLGM